MPSTGVEPLPRIVAWLGYGGLLPFIALALAIVGANFLGEDSAAWLAALVAYSAAILSFVGALHWGFAMSLPGLSEHQRTAAFVWSVIPALVAWLALLAAPRVAIAALVLGFAVHYWRDYRLIASADLPAWYLPMRLRLTCVACVCLVVPAALQVLPR